MKASVEAMRKRKLLTNFKLEDHIVSKQTGDAEYFMTDRNGCQIEYAISKTFRLVPDVDDVHFWPDRLLSETEQLIIDVRAIAADEGYSITIGDAIEVVTNFCSDNGFAFMGIVVGKDQIPMSVDPAGIVMKTLIGSYGRAIHYAVIEWLANGMDPDDIILEMDDRGYINVMPEHTPSQLTHTSLLGLMLHRSWLLGRNMTWIHENTGYANPVFKDGRYRVPDRAHCVISAEKLSQFTRTDAFKYLAIAQGLKNRLWDRGLIQNLLAESRVPFDEILDLPRGFGPISQELAVSIFDAVADTFKMRATGVEIEGLYLLPNQVRVDPLEGVLYLIPKFESGYTPVGYGYKELHTTSMITAKQCAPKWITLNPDDYTFDFEHHLIDDPSAACQLEEFVMDAIQSALSMSPFNIYRLVECLQAVQADIEDIVQGGGLFVPLLSREGVVEKDGHSYFWGITDNIIRYRDYSEWILFSWENKHGNVKASGLFPADLETKNDLTEG